jgi:hypothetical protein
MKGNEATVMIGIIAILGFVLLCGIELSLQSP